MQATLIAIAGPGANIVAALGPDKGIAIGRASENDIALADADVSRQHCTITSTDAGFLLRDLESYNGTSVNGKSVAQHLLQHGDRIRVGETIFLFVESDATPPQTPATFELGDDSLRTQVDALPGAAPPSSDELLLRLARDVQQLSKIATHIGGLHDIDALLTQLVWSLFTVLPVDRCAVVLLDATSEVKATAAWNKGCPEAPVRLSRTILRRILDSKTGLIVHDVLADAGLKTATSFEYGDVRSLICVPMKLGNTVLGAIYGELLDSRLRLDDGHLQMATAIASMAALQIANTHRITALGTENARFREQLGLDHGLIGSSSAIAEVVTKIRRIAATDSTVLIFGETGTGKELVARAIHSSSCRADKSFLAVNCAALTETLLESELFGYEKGAFTGADSRKRGLFEAADGGTIFLDEVGELAPAMQAKLLRVLQQREFVRVGGTQSVHVNVRVVAATNRDLRAMTSTGGFREDLYFRLNVVSLSLPPLRDRKDDISLLAEHFLHKYAAACKRHVNAISSQALDCMLRYEWPGNIRELENAIERAVVLGAADVILSEDLPETLLERAHGSSAGHPAIPNFHAAVLEHKRRLILEAAARANGNLSEAARLLGLHPNYLHRLVTTMNLRAELAGRASA